MLRPALLESRGCPDDQESISRQQDLYILVSTMRERNQFLTSSDSSCWAMATYQWFTRKYGTECIKMAFTQDAQQPAKTWTGTNTIFYRPSVPISAVDKSIVVNLRSLATNPDSRLTMFFNDGIHYVRRRWERFKKVCVRQHECFERGSVLVCGVIGLNLP